METSGGGERAAEAPLLSWASAGAKGLRSVAEGSAGPGSEKNKIVQEDIVSGQFCPRDCVNLILIILRQKKHVLCRSHGQVIKRYVQLSIKYTIGNLMDKGEWRVDERTTFMEYLCNERS